MNEKVTIIEKLQKIFKSEDANKIIALAADNGTSLKLKDGTDIMVSGTDIANDAQVYTVDADNNQTPLPDGTYTLEDGRTFSVVGGKVTDLKDAATDAPAEGDNVAMEAPAEEAVETPADDANEEDDTDARLTALETQVGLITDKVNQIIDMINNTSNVAMSTKEKLDEFMAQPVERTEAPIERKMTHQEKRIAYLTSVVDTQ